MNRIAATTTPWGLVLILGALTAFGPLSLDLYLPSLPAIARSLGSSAAEIQATVAVFFAGMALGQIFYGPASDRFGRRAPVVIGAAIFVVASAACALATTPEMLIGARFVQALGACSGGVVARAIIRDHFDQTEMARMLSLMMMIMGLAPLVAPLLGGFLLQLAGWRAIFWVLVVLGLCIGAAVYFRLPESRSAETAAQARAENPLRAYLALLRRPKFMAYGVAGALNAAALFTYMSSAPDLIIKTFGFSPTTFGWVMGVNSLGLILTGQLNRQLLRRHTPDGVLLTASFASVGLGAGLLLAAFTGWGGQWSVLASFFLIIATYGFLQGNSAAGALAQDPRRAGSASSLLGAMSFGTGAVASALTGLFHDGTARPAAIAIFLVLLGSAALVWTLAAPRRRSPASTKALQNE